MGGDKRSPPLVGERCHGSRGVGADARQATELGGIWRQHRGAIPSTIGDFAGQAMEIPGSRVVTQAAPRLLDLRRLGPRNVGQRRELLEKRAVTRHHPRHLRLLEHQLRDENLIRIAGSSPWEIARVRTEPTANRSAELLLRGVWSL